MSSERDALLAAICANPADDTPRLVFADWLQEHDSPDWAELIRVECELARLADDGSAAEELFRFFAENDDGQPPGEQVLRNVRWAGVDPDIGRRAELTRRAERLRRKARKAIRVALPDGERCGVRWPDLTRRGFPLFVSIEAPDLVVAAAPELMRRCPPLTLSIGSEAVNIEGLGSRLATAGLLRWAEGVSLTSGALDFVAAFSQSPDAAGVREFWQYGGGGEIGISVRWLTTSAHWNGIRSLDFGRAGPLTREAALLLFRSKRFHKLTRLRVSGEGWTPHTIRELNNFTELRELYLQDSELGDDEAVALAKLPGLRNLRSLSLKSNEITGRGATALLTSPHLAGLALLDLMGNPVRGLDGKALAAAPRGGLRAVQFHDCRLTAADVGALAASPRLSDLVYLDLDHNNLAESAVKRLAKGLGSNAPAVLYLLGNNFGAEAARAIAGWEGARKVQMLHLKWNRIDAEGAKALAASPHLTAVRHICAHGLPAAGRNALRKRFGKKFEG